MTKGFRVFSSKHSVDVCKAFLRKSHFLTELQMSQPLWFALFFRASVNRLLLSL